MGSAQRRYIIISDTHLGKPGRGARSAEHLRPLWQGATNLIINGDLAEVHDPRWRTHAARQVLDVQTLCEEDDVELTLLSGNHDPFITDRKYLRLCHGEVFITHGDILHPAISPWTDHSQRLLELHRQTVAALQEERGNQFESQLAAAQYAAHFEWDERASHESRRLGPIARRLAMASKLARVAWYWRVIPKLAAGFAQWHVPESRFFIFGHIHRAGIWQDQGRVIINTGAYDWPKNPRAVVIEDHQLCVHAVQDEGSRFELADKPLERYELYSHAA